MFREFCDFFNVIEIDENKNELIYAFSNAKGKSRGFNELLGSYQRKSFGEGIYRLHNNKNINKWNKIIIEAIPEYKDRIECFGYDWLGHRWY